MRIQVAKLNNCFAGIMVDVTKYSDLRKNVYINVVKKKSRVLCFKM